MKKVVILLILAAILSGCTPAPARHALPAQVFFAGENGSVKTALDLAAQTDALVLDGIIPPGAAERAQAGARTNRV